MTLQISMHSVSAPVFAHVLQRLDHILAKAAQYAFERKVEPATLLSFRLFPDMFPLTRHVQIACTEACTGIARIAGDPPPELPDDEATFEDLRQRVMSTIAYLDCVQEAALNGTEEREVAFVVRGNPRIMMAHEYLTTWVTANFYFHVTVCYAILRHNGVPLGKLDYLDGALLHPYPGVDDMRPRA